MSITKKYTKRLFIILFILIVMIGGGLMGILYFYGDEVKQTLLSQLNEGMQVEISVEDIQLDLFTSFPNASLRFKNILSKEKGALPGNSLIKAGEVALKFNIRDIFKGTYTIDKLSLQDAFLNLVVHEDGSVNYKFINSGDAEKSPVTINLQKVYFKNVVISYIHLPSQQEYLFRVDAGSLEGAISQESQDFTFSGSIYSTHIKSGKNTFLKERSLDIKMELGFNKSTRLVTFRNTQVGTQGLSILLSGKVETDKSDRNLDLDIQVDPCQLSTLMKLIPQSYLEPMKPLSLDGTVSITSTISGKFGGNHIPLINIDFQLADGQAKHYDTDLVLTDLFLNGRFSNGNLSSENTYHLNLSGIRSNFNGGSISGGIDLFNFKTPVINTKVVATIDLSKLPNYYHLDTISKIEGHMTLDISFKNKLKSFRSFTIDDFISSRTTGQLQVKDLNFDLKNSVHTFRDFNGSFLFSNKDLEVVEFSGFVSDNDFSMDGSFRNLLAYAFKPKEKIFIDANFRSSNMNLDKLLYTGSGEEAGNAHLSISDRINYKIDFQIDKFNFRKFSSTNNSGRILQKNRIITVNNTLIHSMDGKVLIQGTINADRKDLYFLNCDADFQKVNINKLFSDFGNFGQKSLTSEHLKGTVDATVNYSSTLTPYLKVHASSVTTLADVHIQDGELIHFQPLEKLSKYVREGEFEHVKFSALKNQIRIEDEVVHIPRMDIESNTMNLSLSGKHAFDNEIDYHLELLLSELIARREVIEEDLGDNFVADDGLGRTKLFLKMYGQADDPVIRYDTREVRTKIADDLKKERQTIRQVFQDEFGTSKNQASDSSAIFIESDQQEDFKIEWEETKKEKPKNDPDTKKQEKPKSQEKEFIIEWEEDNDTIDLQKQTLAPR